MNQKLLQDLEVAYAKLKKSGEARTKVVEFNKRKEEINKKYEDSKKNIWFQTIVDFIWFMMAGGFLIPLIGAALFFKYVLKTDLDDMNATKLLPFCAVFLIPIFIKNIFYCKIKNQKNEKWWATEAQAELKQIDDSINKLEQFCASIIQNDFILGQLNPYARNKSAIAFMYDLVKKGYASSLDSAVYIWEQEEMERIDRNIAAREKEKQLAALNSKLDEINRRLDEQEFIEDMILMDMAYRK